MSVASNFIFYNILKYVQKEDKIYIISRTEEDKEVVRYYSNIFIHICIHAPNQTTFLLYPVLNLKSDLLHCKHHQKELMNYYLPE